MSQKDKMANASPFARVQGVAVKTEVKDSAGVLQRIICSNADVAAQTLTVWDGTDELIIINLAAGENVSLEFGAKIDTSLHVTPSDADIDACVIYD